jgi:hypothetical protein
MAIPVKEDPDPTLPKVMDQTWAMFVRNWGNEGYCSQDQHYLDLYDNQYTFRLPWRGDTVRLVEAKFSSNNQQITDPKIVAVPKVGVFVTFTLPKPEQRAIAHGELHLQWTGVEFYPYVVGPKPSPATTHEVDKHKPEKRLAELYAKMTAAQRKVYLSKLPKPATKVSNQFALQHTFTTKAELPVPVRSLYSHPTPRVRSVHDKQKEDKDRRRYEALREAFGGKIPGVPAAPSKK